MTPNPHLHVYPPGETIPGTVYRVLKKLGEGGMGVVYEVEDTSIGKIYVVKPVLMRHAGKELAATLTMNEARTPPPSPLAVGASGSVPNDVQAASRVTTSSASVYGATAQASGRNSLARCRKKSRNCNPRSGDRRSLQRSPPSPGRSLHNRRQPAQVGTGRATR